MDNQAKQVRVFAVDLKPSHRRALDAEFERYPGVVAEHRPAWVFAMFRADVVVVEADSGTGKEALDMLASFTGAKTPCVLMYPDEKPSPESADDKEQHDRIPAALRGRLEQALNRAHRQALSESRLPKAFPDVLTAQDRSPEALSVG